jgi:hypothetical protein
VNLVGERKGKSVLKVIEREVRGSAGKEVPCEFNRKKKSLESQIGLVRSDLKENFAGKLV